MATILEALNAQLGDASAGTIAEAIDLMGGSDERHGTIAAALAATGASDTTPDTTPLDENTQGE